MRNRIVCIVLALSLLATVFVALPMSAAVDYTGSVKTTDNAKAPKDTYVRGLPIYVSCEVKYQGYASAEDIRVQLAYLDGDVETSFNEVADTPNDGWYNSTELGAETLPTGGVSIPAGQDRIAMYVILQERWTGDEIARTTVTILNPDISFDPPPTMLDPMTYVYTPGQTLTVKLITTYTGDILYVHTTNSTGVDVAGMNWSPVIAPSGYWDKVFTLSTDMPDGHYTMKVRDSTAHTLRDSITFNVQKYRFSVQADRTYYLPGEVAKMEVICYDIATYAQMTTVAVRYWGQWNNFSANGSAVFHTWQNGTLDSSSAIWEFMIPTNVVLYEDLEFMFWGNESAVRSVRSDVTLRIGSLEGSVDAAEDDYVPGETVVVQTIARLYGEALPDANVDVVVLFNGTTVADYGKAAMTTADDGTVSYTFPIAADAAKGVYIVKATISKVGFSLTVTDLFEVIWEYWMDVNFEKYYYYVGESVTATWTPFWNGAVVELTSFNYIVETDDVVLSTGSTEESFLTFDLPADYHGGLWISVASLYNGYQITGGDWADVRIANLAFVAEKSLYRAGDQLVWNWNIETSLEDATLEWEIVDWDGVKVDGDTPTFATSGSFSYDVPTENPSPTYTATIWMTTADGGFASAEAGVSLIGGWELRVWSSGSSYMTGEYRPGDTVKLHYSIAAIYADPFPVYKLVMWTDFDPTVTSAFVNSNEGTVSFELPKDVPAGEVTITVDASDAASGWYLSEDSTKVVVNTKLSGWDRSVAGMAASDFTILLLVIIMIILLIVIPMLKSRGIMSKGEKTETPPPTPPQ